MFSDRHYPPSFLAGNRSLRDMLKDPEEYDRRMESLQQRKEELQKEREAREAKLKRVMDEKSKYLYAMPSLTSSGSSMTRSRESSVTRETTTQPRKAVTFGNDVYRRNSVTRYTPEPERSFIMFVHGAESKRPPAPGLHQQEPARSRRTLLSSNTDSPFQRRPTNTPNSLLSAYSKPSESYYVVRRAASTGDVNGSPASKTEIVPIRPSPTPSPKLETRTSSRPEEPEKPKFYTDKHFSSKFLDDSIPLSRMIVNKK